MPGLFDLPDDVLPLIIAKTNVLALCRLAKTTKRLRKHANDNRQWNPMLQMSYRVTIPGEAKRRFLQHPEWRLPQYIKAQEKSNVVEYIIMQDYGFLFNSLIRRMQLNLLSPEEKNIHDNINKILNEGNLTPTGRAALSSLIIKCYVILGYITIEQANLLSEPACDKLRVPAVMGYIIAGQLTIEQATVLSSNACKNLSTTAVRCHIANNQLTIEQAIQLSDDEIDQLPNVTYNPVSSMQI